MCHIGTKSPKFKTYHLLYSFVAQGLGTTKFTNLVAEINVENGLDFPIYYKHLDQYVLQWKSCKQNARSSTIFLQYQFL